MFLTIFHTVLSDTGCYHEYVQLPQNSFEMLKCVFMSADVIQAVELGC